MSVEILSTGDIAVLIDGATGFAFGPVFRLDGIAFERFNEPFEYAESFVDWCILDLPGYSVWRLAMKFEEFNERLADHEPCAWCPELVPRGDRYCEEHEKERMT